MCKPYFMNWDNKEVGELWAWSDIYTEKISINFQKKFSLLSQVRTKDSYHWENLFKDAHKISLPVCISIKRVNYTPYPIKPSEVMSCLSNNPNVGKPVTQNTATKTSEREGGLRTARGPTVTKSRHVTLQRESSAGSQKIKNFRDHLPQASNFKDEKTGPQECDVDYRPARTVMVWGLWKSPGSIFKLLGQFCPSCWCWGEGECAGGLGRCAAGKKSQGSPSVRQVLCRTPSLWRLAELWIRWDSPPIAAVSQGSRKEHIRLGDWNTRHSLSHSSGGQKSTVLPPEQVWGACAKPPSHLLGVCWWSLWSPAFGSITLCLPLHSHGALPECVSTSRCYIL